MMKARNVLLGEDLEPVQVLAELVIALTIRSDTKVIHQYIPVYLIYLKDVVEQLYLVPSKKGNQITY